ncbi:hypothetical protein AGDE_13700 [Angomonas deanei]|uniref:Uncharacterized protein n=1 Tax=Angomonas deanei TaxID=59799 RepID=A0A7G2C5X0_9TRYP|nr:hypothetical protein AGDE_13700 [Angomonas deanei]CAD2213272.1 hypothetical protein, conserved [Angomonas deanei]|eukprot:EPY21855.1 hypothetical protein AGDE_13700 [Angomonas deanei]
MLEYLYLPQLTLLPLALIVLYLSAVVITVVNTGVYFQKPPQKAFYGDALCAAHLAFCIIGTAVFFCFSSAMWLWSAKYALSRSDRTWRLCVGLWAIYFFKDLPQLVIETVAITKIGIDDAYPFQLVAFFYQAVFFALSTMGTSATYAWYVAGALERDFGSATVPEDFFRKDPTPSEPTTPPPRMLHEGETHSPFTENPSAGIAFVDAAADFNNRYDDALQYLDGPRIQSVSPDSKYAAPPTVI